MQSVDISKVSSKALIRELSSRGRQLGQDGIERAAAAAGDCWMERILPVFHDWLMVRDEPFAIEDFRMCVEQQRPDLMPLLHKAWGSLPKAAKDRGWIFQFGTRPAASRETHGKPVGTYQRACA